LFWSTVVRTIVRTAACGRGLGGDVLGEATTIPIRLWRGRGRGRGLLGGFLGKQFAGRRGGVEL